MYHHYTKHTQSKHRTTGVKFSEPSTPLPRFVCENGNLEVGVHSNDGLFPQTPSPI